MLLDHTKIVSLLIVSTMTLLAAIVTNIPLNKHYSDLQPFILNAGTAISLLYFAAGITTLRD